MGFITNFFGKPKSIINEDDSKELKELRRKAYMEEARKLIQETAKEQARNDLIPKQKKEVW
jgi:spore maturation protein CgeB